MIVFFRKIRRILLVFLWSLYILILSLPTAFRREKWSAVRGMAEFVRKWGMGLLKILNISLTVHGDASKYNGGLIVSNHQGYIDIFVHAAVYGMRFAPKAELRRTPVFGQMTALSHPVWVDRSNRMKSKESIDEFRATLEHKIPMLVYPEGTTGDGKKLLPFKSALFDIAANGALTVQPVLTFYRVPEGADSPNWWDDTTMEAHIWMFLGIPQIWADVYILPEVSTEGLDRKALAARMQEIMSEKYEEILANPGKSNERSEK